MALLPLGKDILPVVMEELSMATLAVYTKVDHNGTGILVCEVAEPLKHFDHGLLIWGLGLVKLASPHVLGVLRLRV